MNFFEQSFEEMSHSGTKSTYEVTYDDGSTETITASDAYMDEGFTLFIDFSGLVAARDSSTIVKVDRMS